MIDCGIGELGGSRFLAVEGAEAKNELVSDRVPIVEEGDNDALDAFDAIVIEERAGVRIGRQLRIGVVLDLAMLLGQDLGAWWY